MLGHVGFDGLSGGGSAAFVDHGFVTSYVIHRGGGGVERKEVISMRQWPDPSDRL